MREQRFKLLRELRDGRDLISVRSSVLADSRLASAKRTKPVGKPDSRNGQPRTSPALELAHIYMINRCAPAIINLQNQCQLTRH